jgi:hypothetical protein
MSLEGPVSHYQSQTSIAFGMEFLTLPLYTLLILLSTLAFLFSSSPFVRLETKIHTNYLFPFLIPFSCCSPAAIQN